MEKGIYVKDIKPNEKISGVFIILNPSKLKSKRGPYWKFLLSDATGTIETKIWYPYSTNFEQLPNNLPVFAAGYAEIYTDKLQLTVDNLILLNDEQASGLERKDFLPTSSFNSDELFNELKNIYQREITYTPLRKFIFLVLNDEKIQQAFKEAPAAKSIHQAYLGGLLEHSLAVAKICLAISDLYPQLDRQLLLAAAILHDIGKIEEYSWSFSFEYTTPGNLLGHLFLGLQLLEPFFEKSKLDSELVTNFKHLILSHHGEYEYGSPKLPVTPEAFVLHFADNLDAKLSLCKSATENLAEGEWTEWQRHLERYLYKPTITPVKKIDTKKNSQDQPCLSLWKE